MRGVGDGGGLGGSAVVFAGVGQGAQRGVPVGFQGVGDEPVGGVDGQVAAAGGVGGVLGALHVKLPEMHPGQRLPAGVIALRQQRVMAFSELETIMNISWSQAISRMRGGSR